jgi:hypothetical protein
MKEQFVGTWQMEAFEVNFLDGETLYPYGREPQGRLMYDGLGNMAVQIMRPGIAPFAVYDRWMGTPEEVRAAFHGYLAYYGSYTVNIEEKTVSHHMSGSVFPNYIGDTSVRSFEFSGERLTLSTPPMPFGGAEGTARLIWVRSSECCVNK